jgi:thiamine pyrophosphokinase
MNILLVLGGESPSAALLNEVVPKADYVIGVDSGMDILQENGHHADLFIGDMDSCASTEIKTSQSLHLRDQNTSDLQKALQHIQVNFPVTSLTIVGGGGGRTDHLINNLHICADFMETVEIVFINDHFQETPTLREYIYRKTPSSVSDLRVRTGATFSIFTLSEVIGLTVRGLKWDIKCSDHCAGLISQSNLAVVDNPKVTIRSGCIYITVYQ